MKSSTCSPHGLWQIRLDDGLEHVPTLGLNSIWVPYSNECLHKMTVNAIDLAKTPALRAESPQQLMYVVHRAAAPGLNVVLDRRRSYSGSKSPLWSAEFSRRRRGLPTG